MRWACEGGVWWQGCSGSRGYGQGDVGVWEPQAASSTNSGKFPCCTVRKMLKWVGLSSDHFPINAHL
jgi:hypothetical protein